MPVIPDGMNIPTLGPNAPTGVTAPSPVSSLGGLSSWLQNARGSVPAGTGTPGGPPIPGSMPGTQSTAMMNQQNLMAQKLQEQRFGISPIEGGSSGGGMDSMKQAIDRAGGPTNGFGYGR